MGGLMLTLIFYLIMALITGFIAKKITESIRGLL